MIIDPRVEIIFAQVVDLAGEDRVAAVSRLAEGDKGAEREVLELLAQLEDDAFLDPDRFARDQSALVFEGLLPVAARIGQYTVLGVLGAGGMGTVYLAEQARPRRQVALKVITSPVAHTATTARFEREAELLGRLSHPGIAQIFEAGIADYGLGPRPFIAMERIEGETLTRYARLHSLSIRDCAEMIASIADAIEHAHLRGVIHRDLKPGNVLVNEHGAPKVVDFGVARAIDSEQGGDATATGGILGTLSYMAPEQIRDPQTVDTRADIYALGVLLFELLTSRQPHDCKTGALTDVIRRVCDEPAPRLSAIDRRLKGELESIVACALEKDRERRYRSAADLSEDLRRCLRGEPIAARRDRLLDALGRSAARNRKVILVGAAALAVAIAVGAWSTAQAARNARLADSERAARDRAVLALDLAQREKARADSESARLRNRLYASNIGFAQAALARADTGRLQRLLADCPVDQRGCEWRYLASFADGADRTAVVNQEGMGYISIDPLRGRIAVERFGDPVKIFPLEGGPELDRYTMERGVYRVSYAPDGTLFTADASGTLEGHAPGPDRAVTVFDTGARGPHFNVRAFPNPQEVIVSDRLGVSKLGPGGAAHWRREGLAAAVLAVAGDTGAVLCGGVSAGTTLLNGHDGAVVWSSEWPAEESRGAAISPDGALAAIASRSGGVSLFDGETGAKLWSVQLSASRTMSIAISADTRSVLIGATDGLIHVLDSATGNPRGMLRGHTGAVTSIEPIEGGRVVSYSRDGTLRWWTVSEIVSGETSEHVADSGLCAVMPFGDGFLTQSFGGELRVFDRSAGAVIWGDNSAVVWRATVSEPAMAAAATRGDGTVVVWKIDEPADARVVKVSETRVSKSAFSSDGAMIAAADDSGRLSIISAETGTVLSQRAVSEHAAIGVLWLPDDSLVMTTGNDGVLRGWRVSADGEIEEGSSAFERPICDTPLWEIAAPRDGRRIAVSGENGIVYLLDTREGSLRELPGHSGPAFGLAFHPSEPRLASVGADGRLRIWDTESGEELLQLGPGGPSLASVAFSANGDRVAAAGADGVLRVWSTPE